MELIDDAEGRCCSLLRWQRRMNAHEETDQRDRDTHGTACLGTGGVKGGRQANEQSSNKPNAAPQVLHGRW